MPGAALLGHQAEDPAVLLDQVVGRDLGFRIAHPRQGRLAGPLAAEDAGAQAVGQREQPGGRPLRIASGADLPGLLRGTDLLGQEPFEQVGLRCAVLLDELRVAQHKRVVRGVGPGDPATVGVRGQDARQDRGHDTARRRRDAGRGDPLLHAGLELRAETRQGVHEQLVLGVEVVLDQAQ